MLLWSIDWSRAFATLLLTSIGCLGLLSTDPGQAQETWPQIERRLPPPGQSLPEETQQALRTRLSDLDAELDALPSATAPWQADVRVLIKAVRWGLKWDEFYQDDDVAKAQRLLDLAEQRIQSLQAGTAPWNHATGRVVRGYRSTIDGSLQPYGLEIPDSFDGQSPLPLYVWLHGRGDRITDLHFLDERLQRPGTVSIPDAIVVHPFGRHCMGFKHAGEIDVLDVVREVQRLYPIDPQRIVLMGFSMGGAGCWHIGAHYPDRWVAMSPGAGFAETAQYNRLAPSDYPPIYEQQLWQLYDVPSYTLNLFNLPVIAYSGEDDRQIQAARVMEQAFQREGRTLPHLIGPRTGHRYHPETLQELLERLRADRDAASGAPRDEIFVETPTLRYGRVAWLEATGLAQHWRDSRLVAKRTGNRLELKTQNIREFQIHDPRELDTLTIDQQVLENLPAERPLVLSRQADVWSLGSLPGQSLRKRPGLQGPIDDAFLEPFLVVTPSESAAHPRVQRWLDFELAHFQARWSALFRGDLRIKQDTDVTPDDEQKYHLIVWGDPASNRYLQKVLDRLPLDWDADQLSLGHQVVSSSEHIPVLVYPNPRQPDRYLVLNSGPTFREGHDRTNSLQNPKLPDWAVLDLSQPPSDTSAGRVLAADFFDETWQIPGSKPR